MSNLAEQEKMYTEEEYYSLDLPARTELINWRINYLAAPSTQHQDIQYNLAGEIRDYIKRNKGKCKVMGAPTDVKLKDGIIVQPDIYVTCDRDKIGKQYHNGAPDWIIEIVSPSNSQHDYDEKFWLYKKYGVKEYWIIDPLKESVLVYIFGEGMTFGTYTFAEHIPVELYKTEKEPLTICIKEAEY